MARLRGLTHITHEPGKFSHPTFLSVWLAYPESDSNRHCNRLKRFVSCQLDYPG